MRPQLLPLAPALGRRRAWAEWAVALAAGCIICESHIAIAPTWIAVRLFEGRKHQTLNTSEQSGTTIHFLGPMARWRPAGGAGRAPGAAPAAARRLLLALALLCCARQTAALVHDFDLNELPPEATDLGLGTPSTASAELGQQAGELERPPQAAGAIEAAASAVAVRGNQDELKAGELAEMARRKRRELAEAAKAAQAKAEAKEREQMAFRTGAFLWGRVRSGLPSYFNFCEWKDQFNREYTANEDFLRRSIFLQSALKAFRERVDYRRGSKTYLLEMNQFSDRTPDELRRMFMPAPPFELLLGSGEGARSWSEREAAFQQWREQIEKRSQELERVERERERQQPPELQSHGCEGPLSETGLLNEVQAKRLIERLYSESSERDRSYGEALLQELRGSDFEMSSRAPIRDDQSAQHRLDSLRQRWLEAELEAPSDEEAAEAARRPYEPPAEWGQEHEPLDWSKHKCFHTIYNQGNNCGKCYVLAAVSLVEFYKCLEQDRKRKFSSDYVLHCAQKFTPTVMGCAGGSPLDTLRFIVHSGIFTIKEWREERLKALRNAKAEDLELDSLDMRCPDLGRPMNQWGPIRFDHLQPVAVSARDFMEALEWGPLIVTVQMPAEGVASYAGGVHDGQGCESSRFWHEMVLVGYGRTSSGQRYWRFRNSFGPDWGDAGHFNLDMAVPAACLVGGVRLYKRPAAAPVDGEQP